MLVTWVILYHGEFGAYIKGKEVPILLGDDVCISWSDPALEVRMDAIYGAARAGISVYLSLLVCTGYRTTFKVEVYHVPIIYFKLTPEA